MKIKEEKRNLKTNTALLSIKHFWSVELGLQNITGWQLHTL